MKIESRHGSVGCKRRLEKDLQLRKGGANLVVKTHGHINSAGCVGMAQQRQLRLLITPSGGTSTAACMLHKSPKASSSLTAWSRLPKKLT